MTGDFNAEVPHRIRVTSREKQIQNSFGCPCESIARPVDNSNGRQFQVHYAIYFFVGALLYRQRQSLHVLVRFGKSDLFIGGLMFAATLPMIHEHTTIALTGWRLARLSGQLSLFAWFTTFGLLALFLNTRCIENGVTRFLAGASFWIYLVHLPFVALTQIAIVQMAVPASCKFLLAATTAVALALMTYHVFVRRTWIGVFLDGHTPTFPLVVESPEPVFPKLALVVPGHTLSVRTQRSTAPAETVSHNT